MKIMTLLITGILFVHLGCSAGKQIKSVNLNEGQAVKLIFQDGTSENVYIKSREVGKITYVAESDHQSYTVDIQSIIRVEKLNLFYDEFAYPISSAEIKKYKSNENTWAYALGGSIISGAVGLVLGLPFWYADVGGIPPYFVAGAGVVFGSIVFAYRGQEKDKLFAAEKIRYLRSAERRMKEEIEQEKEILEKIEEEKKEIKDKLKDKSKISDMAE